MYDYKINVKMSVYCIHHYCSRVTDVTHASSDRLISADRNGRPHCSAPFYLSGTSTTEHHSATTGANRIPTSTATTTAAQTTAITATTAAATSAYIQLLLTIQEQETHNAHTPQKYIMMWYSLLYSLLYSDTFEYSCTVQYRFQSLHIFFIIIHTELLVAKIKSCIPRAL